ncbi:MAG: hypothetical protein IKT39_00795 [Clostridia bacterium]|nr:hypothetical protein [Clostridia bacterium]
MSDNRDIVKEAQEIIDSYANRIPSRRRITSKRKKTSEKTLWFFAGIATSTALLLSLFLKIY